MANRKSDLSEEELWRSRSDGDNARKAVISAAGRDIGPIPPVVNPQRREASRLDFRNFCETYIGQTFTLRWSGDHLKVIGCIEEAVLRGGLFALAMPRGSGKTSLCETACVWALLHGHRRYVVLVGADASHAQQMLDSIKAEIAGNELLLADYPEVCFPIVALDGITKRCQGQTSLGERTLIEWGKAKAVLPTKAGSLSSGSAIDVVGITGRIRGLKHKTAGGESIRPDLVVIDDPQTDESASSASQCATRERTLAGAVLGLAGPGKKISGVMPCTVIRPGDMADRILDRQVHPEWHGERTKLVYSFPTNTKLWDQYAEIRAESMRAGRAGEEATAFYVANREEMDAGAVVAWPERYNPDEVSALQNAMNLRGQSAEAFASEYQNEPAPLDDELAVLSAAKIIERVNRIGQRVVPGFATTLTTFIDVQQDLLYYAVCAWGNQFAGAVIDYGTFPEQHRSYFTLREANPTIRAVTGLATLDASLTAALQALCEKLLSREWQMDGGGVLRIERGLIDASWGESTEAIYRFAKQSGFAALVTPSHGKGIGAASNPMSEWSKKPGEKRGVNWLMPAPKPGRSRHVVYDANFWKSFVCSRLSVPIGEAGGLTLFGDRPTAHRLFADHLVAERPVRTQGRGREVDEWRLKVTKPDNHWFDCVVGCAVAAAMQGITTEKAVAAEPKKKTSYREMYDHAKRNRGRD